MPSGTISAAAKSAKSIAGSKRRQLLPVAPAEERLHAAQTSSSRHARLTDADRAEWASFARLVTPLPGRIRPEPATAQPPAKRPPLSRALLSKRTQPPSATQSVPIGLQPPGVDNATWQKFRTGRLAAARTLDLHGRTAQRAYHALEAFLRAAHADRVRCVEVITGRGSGEEGGVLRRELPLWLNLPTLRPLILGAAHPHPANPGSVRLLLRRVR